MDEIERAPWSRRRKLLIAVASFGLAGVAFLAGSGWDVGVVTDWFRGGAPTLRGDWAVGEAVAADTDADAGVVAAVSRRAFLPVPRVDSVTVGLIPRPWTWPVARPSVLTLVDQGFAQRRKRLRNALAPLVPAAAVEAALGAIGRAPDARAEQLDLATWCEFTAALRERHIAGWEPAPLA